MNKNKRNLCILCLCVMLFCILFKLYSGNNLLVERYEGEDTVVNPISPTESLTEENINEILSNSSDIPNSNLIPNLTLTMPTNIDASYLEESTLLNDIYINTDDFITTKINDGAVININKIKTQYNDDDESALKNGSYLKEIDENINVQITNIEGIIDNNNQKINNIINKLKSDINSHHSKLYDIDSNDNYIRDVISGGITICDDIQHLKSFKDFKENIDTKISNLKSYQGELKDGFTLDLTPITTTNSGSDINSQIVTVVGHINNHLNALHHNRNINDCTYYPEDESTLSVIKCKLNDLIDTNNVNKKSINDYFSGLEKNLNTDNITPILVQDLEDCQTKLNECNTLYDNINNMLRTNIAMRESAAYPGGISEIVNDHCFNLNESEGCNDYLTSIGHGPGCVVQCSVKDDQGNCLVVNKDSVNIYAGLEGGSPIRIHTHPHTHGGEGWGGVIPSDGSTEGTTIMDNPTVLTEGTTRPATDSTDPNTRYEEEPADAFVGTHKIEPFVGSMYATF